MKLYYYTFFAAASSAIVSQAHVQLLSPPSIINSDYQYTFAPGVCARTSCDAFCGESDINPTVSSIEPDDASHSIDVNLLVSVRHNPFKYRLSLYDGNIDTISGFDTNVLVDNIELESGSKTGWVSVQIPRDVTCDPYCVLQLYDYYYFVSCAKITLGKSSEETNPTPAVYTTISETEFASVESDYIQPVIVQEEVVFQDIPAVRITMTASPDYLTYMALGISSDGSMVGSTAIVGSIGESHNIMGGMITETGIYNVTNTTTEERILGGKFLEFITPTFEDEKLELVSDFRIDYWEYGKMNHTLEVVIRKETEDGSSSICGKKIIWAHSSSANPSMTLTYHGVETRGAHLLPVTCAAAGTETSPTQMAAGTKTTSTQAATGIETTSTEAAAGAVPDLTQAAAEADTKPTQAAADTGTEQAALPDVENSGDSCYRMSAVVSTAMCVGVMIM